MVKNYRIITPTDSDALNKLLDELEDAEYVAFDIETNSAIEKIARVIGIGVTQYADEGYYIPFARFCTETQQLISLLDKPYEDSLIAELCSVLQHKKLIMHNGVFDVNVIKHAYGIDLTDALYADTILMKHTVDEERPFGLKEVAEKFKEHIGFTEEEAANQEQLELKESVIRNGGKWTKTQKDIYKGDLEIIGKYCAADVDLTLKLFEYFEYRLKQENLTDFFYHEEVMPLYKKSTIPMKFNGVYVDINYFKSLEKELESDIIKLTDSIFDLIEEDIQPLVEEILDNKIKETKTGRYAEGLLQYYSIPIPLNKKTGKPTVAKTALQSLLAVYPEHPALTWLLHEPRTIEYDDTEEFDEPALVEVDGILVSGTRKATRFVKKLMADPNDPGPVLPSKIRYAVKKTIFVDSKPELPHVFNLASNDHLSWLVFQCYKEEPRNYSRLTDKPQVDKDSLESYDHLPFIKQLLELKKTEKLLNTYVKPILETNINGWIYPSMLQFGTTSGRYSCAGGLNLQTLPREDKRVKRGFIAPPGYKVVNADFSSLEPRIFSWVCGDPGLKRVWEEGLDLYSQIAIDVFGLKGVSARESDPNYLKKVYPDKRQDVKTFSLACVYGASEYRIAEIAKVDPLVAREWIYNYLESYPKLKDYMMNQDIQARTSGFVKTKFGRIRHLSKAKELYLKYGNKLYNKRAMKALFGESKDEDGFGSKIYYEFRNQLNNAKNSPIQGTAAHVCNNAMIKLADLFKEYKIQGWICLNIHDEIPCYVRDPQAELASKLLKEAMERNRITEQIDVPITASPIIGNNFAESKE